MWRTTWENCVIILSVGNDKVNKYLLFSANQVINADVKEFGKGNQ